MITARREISMSDRLRDKKISFLMANEGRRAAKGSAAG
jgi:hypothetical protein